MYKIGDEVVVVDPPPYQNSVKKGDAYIVVKEPYMNEEGMGPYICVKKPYAKDYEYRTWYPSRVAPMWKLWTPDMEPLKAGDVVKIGELVNEIDAGFPEYAGIAPEMRNFVGKEAKIAGKYEHSKKGTLLFLDVDNGEFVWNACWLFVKNTGVAKPATPVAKWKVGDVVVCTKKVETEELRFSPHMDVMLEKLKKFKVEGVDEKTFVVKGGGWYWPQDCLEMYDMAKHVPKKGLSVAQLKAQVREKAKNEGSGSCASYAVIVKDSKGVAHALAHLTDLCHARLDKKQNYDKRDKWDKAVAILDFFNNGIKRHAKCLSEYKAYLSYIFTKSPWAVAFKSKGIRAILDNGVEYDVSQPSGVIAGAAIAARMAYEYPERLPVFSLVRQHASEDAAWLCFYAFAQNGKNYTMNSMGGGHEALDGNNMALDCIISLFANGYPEKAFKAKPYSEESKYRVFETIGDDTYYGGKNRWKPKYGLEGTFKQFVKQKAKGKEKGKGWEAVTVYDENAIIEFAKQLDIVINNVRAKEVK